MPNLIAMKEVDLSLFRYGSHIPLPFHEDFKDANGGVHLDRGQKHEVKLYIDGTLFDAILINIKRTKVNIDTLQIRWDNNKELKTKLQEIFKASYGYIQRVEEQHHEDSPIKIKGSSPN
jgi:hypothetical protein